MSGAPGEQEELTQKRTSRTDEVDKQGRVLITPTRWEETLAGENCCGACSLTCCPCGPCVPFLLLLALMFVFTNLLMTDLRNKGTDALELDESNSQDVRSNIIVKQFFGVDAAIRGALASQGFEYSGGGKGGSGGSDDDDDDRRLFAPHRGWPGARVYEAFGALGDLDGDDDDFWGTPGLSASVSGRALETAEEKSAEMMTQDERSLPAGWVMIVYEAEEGGNVLSDKYLEKVLDFETKLLGGLDTKIDGTPSKWQDWCMLAHPAGDSDAAPTCAPAMSLGQFFHLGDAATTMPALARDGFVSRQLMALEAAGIDVGEAAACLMEAACTDEVKLCGFCNEDGSVGVVPDDVKACLGPLANAVFGGMPASMSPMGYEVPGLCSMKPECGWAPPGYSTLCSTSSFAYEQHGSKLQPSATRAKNLKAFLCAETDFSSSMRKQFLPKDFSCDGEPTAKFLRSVFFFGGPLEGYSSWYSKEAEQEKAIFKYVEDRDGWYNTEQRLEASAEESGEIRVMMTSTFTLGAQMLFLLSHDGLLSVLALLLVFVYMYFTVESLFLSICGMTEIVMSLPVAFFIWLATGNLIAFLQIMVIYIILGIGADDVFVFHDAWEQSAFQEFALPEDAKESMGAKGTCGDRLLKRFAWTYRRAFNAMFVTTATTMGSFLCGAMSPIPFVRDFCVFAAIVVLVDYLFCVSFFASATMINERYFKHACICCCGPEKAKGECCGPGCCFGAVRSCKYKAKGKAVVKDTGAPPDKRWLETFCEGPLYNFLVKARKPLIGLWSFVLFLALISGGVGLKTATKPPELGRQDSDMVRIFSVLLEEFYYEGRRPKEVRFGFGLDPDDPVEYGAKRDKDTPKYRSNGAEELMTVEGQRKLLELCRSPDLADRCDNEGCLFKGTMDKGRCPQGNTTYYMPDDVYCRNGRYCFLEDVADYWAHKEGTVFNGIPGKDLVEILESDEYVKYLAGRDEQYTDVGREYEIENFREKTGAHVKDGKIQFAWITFNGTYPTYTDMNAANAWYDKFEEHHEENHGEALKAIQTSQLYRFMVTQNELFKAAIGGVIASLCCTFIVLLGTTKNWIIACLGSGTILVCTVDFLGLIPIVGWELGSNESVFLIIVVGLSVDYSAHLLHAYNHSSAPTRELRTKDALAEMGVSVLSGAATTLLSASALFGCIFWFFFQFGIFIFTVIFLAIVMATFLLVPLMLTFGPEGDAGDLSHLLRGKQKLQDSAPDSQPQA